ncbi:MAG: sigma-70 family RNA polymerase sigma factor [Phycisphaerales bacterium]|nr:sigma-70 family RNA polymerase sigma factor [Phycisphaerales bacterium]
MTGPAIHNTTTTALLESLKDPGQDAVWREFDARYRPVLFALAQRIGLNRTDAEEIAQATLVEFIAAYRAGRYDRSRGRLSSWIIGIARNQIGKCARSKGRAAEHRGDSAIAQLHDPAQATRLWAAEQKRVNLARAWEMLLAARRTSAATLKAFELFAIRGTPAAAVAAECGMTIEDVYVAKSRVSKRLRDLVEELNAAYREDP